MNSPATLGGATIGAWAVRKAYGMAVSAPVQAMINPERSCIVLISEEAETAYGELELQTIARDFTSVTQSHRLLL